MFLEQIDQGTVAWFTNSQRSRNCRGDHRGIKDWREIDKERSAWKALGGVAGDFDGEPCLSCSGWTGERQEPRVRLSESAPDQRQLSGAADQWARLSGKGRHVGFAQ